MGLADLESNIFLERSENHLEFHLEFYNFLPHNYELRKLSLEVYNYETEGNV